MKCTELPDYAIIDAHMHPYLARHRNFPFDIPESYEEFFAEQRRAGIGICCGSFNIRNDGSDFSVIKECNRQVLEIHASYKDSFLPGVNVHPNFPEESCAEIQRFYDLGFRWIGEVAGYVMNYQTYFREGFMPIFELAQDLDMVLNVHPSTLEDVSLIVSNFPKLKLVVAHPEALRITECYRLAQEHDNLYFDLSGSGLARWGMLKKGVQLIGAERFIFGTDFPLINPGMYVAGVLFEHLNERERKLILHDNFLNLTGYNL